MGYIPPKPIARQVGDVRIEFVMTPKGWHHCWDACVSSKKCKWLGAAEARRATRALSESFDQLLLVHGRPPRDVHLGRE